MAGKKWREKNSGNIWQEKMVRKNGRKIAREN
jgi:hypothetical protein